MPQIKYLKPVKTQKGRPLYQAAREALQSAIDAGHFQPGEQIPNTVILSKQLNVSLVTAHRALQELVRSGTLYRAQGKGTFVHSHYEDQRRLLTGHRVGIILHDDASITNCYLHQILEGIRRAADEADIHLQLLRPAGVIPHDMHGYVFLNPTSMQLKTFMHQTNGRHPVFSVAGPSRKNNINYIEMDEVDLVFQAVEHLTQLGHTQLAYIGGIDQQCCHHDRWQAWLDACKQHHAKCESAHVLKCAGWRLKEKERQMLDNMLSEPNRPTAIFAGGYDFALDVYAAAAKLGLTIGKDISVMGVDDPPSAAYLSPALTTLRQPLLEMGYTALAALTQYFRNPDQPVISQSLQATLIRRQSTQQFP